MTPEEYDRRKNEIVKEVHPTLASFIMTNAYERGNAYGNEEVLQIIGVLVSDTREINELLMDHPNLLFWEVEDYLWTLGYSHPPGSELREWYLSGWVELTNYRPDGPLPEYVVERSRRRNPS